jgi:tRNA(adenine34) deaminase
MSASSEAHCRFMDQALAEARKALSVNEFPVGCVLAGNGVPLATGRRQNSFGTPVVEIDHAEIVTLRNLQARGLSMDNVPLTLYSTMEPCLMCYAALILNGVSTIVFAYEDVMGGVSGVSLDNLPAFYRERRPRIVTHVRRNESLKLFQRFFRDPENRYWRDSRLARYTLSQECR